jgi:hypothetical protein
MQRNLILQIIGCLLMVAASLSATKVKDLNPATSKPAMKHAAIPLFKNGKPVATICVMGKQSQKTKQAIRELQTCMKLIGGEKLPILKDKLVKGPAIVIGNCPEAKAIGLDGKNMPIEGFAVKSIPNRVFIVGHDDKSQRSNGTAWGIYDFLERVAGVRWYWTEQNGGRSTIADPNLNVSPLWINDAPAFRKREIWPSHLAGLGQLHAALRAGNSWPVEVVVHAPNTWGKIKDYVKNRPEVFQLSKDGKRDDKKMLCYGNKRTLETYLELIEKHFDKGQKVDLGIIKDSITVSPWDVNVACYCDECRKLWDERGGAFGSASVILETFVAKLAKEVKKRWPDKTIIYLPYMNYTIASGKVKFPDNVEVQLCGMPGVALYKEPIINKQFQGNIDKWKELTRRKVQTWDYSCWPEDKTNATYHYPGVLKKYYQNNRHKIIGTFINGVTDHWPRSNWSLYCWMKLLWNPDFDIDAAADEFCKRMFGPAASPMRELLTLQINQWEQSRFSNGTLSAEGVYKKAFPKAVVDKMKALLAEAHKLGDSDPLIKKRLEYYETPFAAFYKEYDFVIEGKGMTPLIVKKTGEMPIIDGKLDDKVWQNAPKASFHTYNPKTKEQGKAKFPTTIQALWNTDGIMLGFYMKEPNPKALKKDKQNRDDGGLYWQDCVDFYIDTTGSNSGQWYQFMITAGGALYDSKRNDVTWTCDGLKFKSYVGNDFWSMEVFIHHKSLDAEVKTSATGLKWYGQFCRNRMSDGKGGYENQKLNAHQPGFNRNTGDFTELRFME